MAGFLKKVDMIVEKYLGIMDWLIAFITPFNRHIFAQARFVRDPFWSTPQFQPTTLIKGFRNMVD